MFKDFLSITNVYECTQIFFKHTKTPVSSFYQTIQITRKSMRDKTLN